MVFLPYIISGVAISYVFSYLFSPVNGAFNGLLDAIKLEILSQSWPSNPKIVNYTLVFVSLRRFSGCHIILFMLPTILIYLFFQRYILAGVAAGAVKE